MVDYSDTINKEKALIWRIVHLDNIPWILDNGLHCGNSQVNCPTWVDIGNPDLISKRSTHLVPVPPGGYLNDYVPFYFTPFSPMLYSIHTGHGGITKQPNDKIVILVSSLHRIVQMGLTFLFTDMHAYLQYANFYTDLADLDKIDWSILQARDFQRDQDDPEKVERYQAEALIHRHCPTNALEGMICYNNSVKYQLEGWVRQHQIRLSVYDRRGWYF